MNWATLSNDEIRAAQLISFSAMALWIGVGVVPGLQRRSRTLRGWILALYLAACAGFTLYVLLR
jgi:hypothetical protein